MSFSGEQYYVAIVCDIERTLNRGESVGDSLVILASHARLNVVDDRIRIFRPRVVAGDDRAVGAALSDFSHDWTLTLIAIPATAEHHYEFSSSKGSGGAERAL